MLDFLRFFSGLFICRPALPCFLPVLGGAGGGAGPLPPSSLSGGGGAEAAMDWGTRVSVGGGWKRPQAAPSPGGESGAAQHPRAAARPRHGGEGEGAEPEHQLHACSRLTARPRLQQPEPELQWVATTKLRGEGKMGRAQTPHPGRLGLATPLLRSVANTARAGLAAVRGAPLDRGPGALPVGPGAVRTRPLPP